MTNSTQLWRTVVTDGSQRDVSEALGALSGNDLLRLRALAKLRARGLPGGVAWSDLLHEAIVRALEGTRRWPPNVPLLAFLAGIMRSLCDEQWRRRRREGRHLQTEGAGEATVSAFAFSIDPERDYAAAETLASLDMLFAHDVQALKVIAGVSAGLVAGEIQVQYGLTSIEYDTARRRMRRTLLRHGLAWSWP